MVRFIVFVAILLLVIGPAAPLQGQPHTVLIGVIIPLTGETAVWGEDLKRALPLLEAELNSRQTAYQFKFLLEDGKCGHENAAITAARKLVTMDKVSFLVTGCSGEVLQIAPFAETNKIFAIAYCAGHHDIANAGDYVFRTYIDLSRGAELVSDDIVKRHNYPLAILTEENAFTIGIKRALQKHLGDKVGFADDYALGDADLRSLILRARATRPRAYYLNAATPQSFVMLFRQLQQAGITSPKYAYFNPGVKSVQEALGKSLEDTVYFDVPDALDTTEDYQQFLAAFRQVSPDGPVTPFLLATAYNAFRVIYDGVLAVGPDATKVKEFAYRYDAPSATGRLRFDKNGDVLDLNFTLRTYQTQQKSNSR